MKFDIFSYRIQGVFNKECEEKTTSVYGTLQNEEM